MAAVTTASASMTLTTAVGDIEPRCRSCYLDPICRDNPLTATAQNELSVCRYGHGAFFLGYALLLVIIIIMVWLTSNGSVSTTVTAWVATFISAVVILLMGMHWWIYVKGVIPECCDGEGCAAPY